MQSDNLIKGTIGAALGVVLIVVLALPVIASATETETTFNNAGVFNYGIFEPTDTYTLTFDISDGSIEVNGTTVTPLQGISATSYNSYSVISTDNVLFRYGSNNSGYYMHVLGVDENNANVLTGMTNGTVTITGGKLVMTNTLSDNTTTTKTFSFTELYAIVPAEDQAVLKASSSEVYIKGDSELYASGLTTVSAWSNMFHFEGTYDDGITITSANLASATFDNIEWNIEPVSGYIDLYKLTSVEFDIHYNDTTVHATYSYFAVPSEVTAEKAIHLDSTEITMLELVPLLLAVVVVLGVIAYAMRARLS